MKIKGIGLQLDRDSSIEQLTIQKLSADPSFSDSREGTIYYNSDLKAVRYFDGNKWITLAIGSYSSSDGTLQEFVEAALAQLDINMRDFVGARYTTHRQTMLTKLQADAAQLNDQEAFDYIQGFFDWLEACFGVYYAAEDEIVTIADGSDPESTKRENISAVVSNVDYNSLEAADPGVSIRQAQTLLYGSSSSSSE